MFSWTRRRSATIFAVAFVFIALFQVFVPESFRLDSSDYTFYYSVVARNLLAGNGFTLADGRFAAANPPGYPIIVAAILWLAQFGISEALLFGALNAACLAISVVVVYRLSRNLWDERSGLLAAGLWLTYPFMLLLSTERLTEPPFISALYIGMAIFWHALKTPTWHGFALTAVFLGIAMLLRSIAIAILPVCVLILLFSRCQWQTKLGGSAVLIGLGALIVAPWTLLIYVQTNQLVLLGTNSAPSVRDGLTFAVGKAYRQEFPVSEDVIALMERLLARRNDMNTLSAIVEVVGEESADDRGALAKLLAMKVVRSWYATDTGRFETIALLIQIAYLIPIGIGSLIAFRHVPHLRGYVFGVWLIVLYFWFMTFLVLFILRYMAPVMGLLMTLAPGVLQIRR